MKLLDLFCGAGGAAMGYHLAGFNKIIGVDNRPQKNYPFSFIQDDVFCFIKKTDLRQFDLIHASPPCQAFSSITPKKHRKKHPNYIPIIRNILKSSGVPYVIENVTGARKQLKNPIKLCGSMFGLKIFRHRYFEIWPEIFILLPGCKHDFKPVLITGTTRRFTGHPKEFSIEEKRLASGIKWMTTTELDQAIPPAYTKFIGEAIRHENNPAK